MKEEEIINKLENTELPRIEVEGHQRRLKMALLQSGYFEEHPGKVAVLKSKIKGGVDTMKGLFSWRPRWKPALVSTLVLALIVGSALFIPSLIGPSPEVLAAEIAQNSPEVRALVGGAPVIRDVKMVGGTGYVLCQGPEISIVCEVDVKTGEELKLVRVVKPPELSDEEKAKAIEIAKADPRVQDLLGRGGTIDKVFLSVHMLELEVVDGKPRIATEVMVMVAVILDNQKWMVEIDLDEGIVWGIAEPKLTISEEKALIEEKQRARAEPVEPSLSPPPMEELMEELIDIAKTDPQAKELFDRGARLVGSGIAGKADAEKGALVLELGNERWIVRIDLVKEEVTKVEPLGEIEPGEILISFESS